jgi:hypothetical protein
MKQYWMALWISLSLTSVSFAQVPERQEEAPPEEIQVVPTGRDSSGTAAIRSSNNARTSSLQNWIFAGSALVVAAIGVAIVSMNTGSDVSQSQ